MPAEQPPRVAVGRGRPSSEEKGTSSSKPANNRQGRTTRLHVHQGIGCEPLEIMHHEKMCRRFSRCGDSRSRYHGSATARKGATTAAGPSRARSGSAGHRGAARTSATGLCQHRQSEQRLRQPADAARRACRSMQRQQHGGRENVAAIGISGTPTWLDTSQPPQQPRMRVANHAARPRAEFPARIHQ